MPFVNISAKGQITLPAAMRRRLGIASGDRVSIEEADGAIVIRKAPDFFQYKGFLGKGLPAEEERKRMAKGIARHVMGGVKKS